MARRRDAGAQTSAGFDCVLPHRGCRRRRDPPHHDGRTSDADRRTPVGRRPFGLARDPERTEVPSRNRCGAEDRATDTTPRNAGLHEGARRMSNDFVYVTYIYSTPQKVWDAITKPEFAKR